MADLPARFVLRYSLKTGRLRDVLVYNQPGDTEAMVNAEVARAQPAGIGVMTLPITDLVLTPAANGDYVPDDEAYQARVTAATGLDPVAFRLAAVKNGTVQAIVYPDFTLGDAFDGYELVADAQAKVGWLATKDGQGKTVLTAPVVVPRPAELDVI